MSPSDSQVLPYGRYRTFGSDGRVWSSPGYVIVIQRMRNGREQEIAVDPDEVAELIEVLRMAVDHP